MYKTLINISPYTVHRIVDLRNFYSPLHSFHPFFVVLCAETHLEESHKSVFGFENRQRLEIERCRVLLYSTQKQGHWIE